MIDAEILRDQFFIFLKLAGFAREDTASRVENDGGIGDVERKLEILLDENDRLPLLFQAADGAADLGHDEGGEALGGLVQQEHARISHQRTADREHLLLTA